VLIAGCGYLGSELARQLVSDGHEVYGLRRGASGVPAKVVPIEADLAEAEDLAIALPRRLDLVFFTAGADRRDEASYRRTYVAGIEGLLQALALSDNEPRIVFTSSTSVYGQSSGEWVDESSPARPSTWWGRVQLEAEARLAAASVPFSVARLAGLYGPGRTRLIDRAREPLEARPARQAEPHFTNRIHRDDAAAFLLHLARIAAPERLYLACDNQPADRAMVLRWIRRASGLPGEEVDSERDWTRASGKRCLNRRLIGTGFRLRYPTFREGYAALLASYERSDCPPHDFVK
jgi:nucleoside-diphosphate-sugar epimerase